MNVILNARQKRSQRISLQLQNGGNCLCIRANYPTGYKNCNNADLAISLAYSCIKSKIIIYNVSRFRSADGSYIIANFNLDAIYVKKIAIEIENSAFGRCVDIDVYEYSPKMNDINIIKSGNNVIHQINSHRCNDELISESDNQHFSHNIYIKEQISGKNLTSNCQISRTNLNVPPRNCVVCNVVAAICVRNYSHSNVIVAGCYDKILEDYLAATINSIVYESFFLELNLDNKFGLVSPNSNGSHLDMNYQMLESAIKEITPVLRDIFIKCLFNKLTIDEARQLGIFAYEQMNKVTNNINAYKGAIFVVGTILYGAAFSLRQHCNLKHTFNYAADFFGDIPKQDTAGYRAYTAGIGGIRKEINSNYSSVRKASKLLKYDFSDTNLRSTLCKIVGFTDDSVLYKRSNGKYKYFRKLISTCNDSNLQQVNDKCIENNISIGGSADLLIASIIYNKLLKLFNN